MPATGFNRTFLYMTGPLIIWSARFLAVYSFTAFACSRGWVGVVAAGIAVLSAAAVLGCLGFLAWSVIGMRGARWQPAAATAGPEDGIRSEATRENTVFVHSIAAAIALLGLLAIIWETLPILLVPVCT